MPCIKLIGSIGDFTCLGEITIVLWDYVIYRIRVVIGIFGVTGLGPW
jgi:hypothetical protein